MSSTCLNCSSRSNARSISARGNTRDDVGIREQQRLEVAPLGERLASRCAAPTRTPARARRPSSPARAAPTPRTPRRASGRGSRASDSGWTTMPAHDAREAPQHVIERDEAVGQNDPLDRRMRDVALVPERDVLERRLAVAAKQPRQADDLLAADRIALVRHRRRALLALGERLLHLADFGLLQPADFERELLERGRRDRQRRQQLGVTIALNHLRGDRRRPESEPAADVGLDRRRQVRERADRARQLADADRRPRARRTRSMSRSTSAYHSASFSPNVIGSACTPCVRPIIGVRRCSKARSRIAVGQRVEIRAE